MKTPRNFAINTRWGHTNQKTSTLHHHPKQLELTETYLFGIFPTCILTDIDIWVSGLKHLDKFKAVIKNTNNLYNPTLLAITTELRAPYHNSSVYSCWYTKGFYKWEYRHIPIPCSDSCSRYQLLGNYFKGINKLTQWQIEFHESVVASLHITWDKMRPPRI